MLKDFGLLLTGIEPQTLSGVAASTNVLDLGQVKPTPGMNRELSIVFQVATDVTGKLQFKLQHCDTENGTFTDVCSGGELTAPTAGYQESRPLPHHTKRFIRAYFGGAPTAGAVKAFVTYGVEDWYPHKQAQVIDDLVGI